MPLDSSSCDKYQLIDFGAGRKLELLSGYLVDRPSPADQAATPEQALARRIGSYDENGGSGSFASLAFLSVVGL